MKSTDNQTPAPDAKADILPSGQLTPRMEKALRQAGAALTDDRVAKACHDVDQARADYAARALETGIVLLAKRATFPARSGKGAGKWKAYLEKLSEANKRNAFRLLDAETIRSCQLYMQLARRFLWLVETRAFRDLPQVAAFITPPQADALDALRGAGTDALAADPSGHRSLIRAYAAGRSLRNLMSDLRKAEQQMEAEDAATESETASGDDPPPPPLPPIQTILWRDWVNTRRTTIDRVFTNPEINDLEPPEAAEYWEGVAADLAKARDRADLLAKAAREGAAK